MAEYYRQRYPALFEALAPLGLAFLGRRDHRLRGTAVARGFDITDEGPYRDLVTLTIERFGGLHGLFNVAADLSPRTIGRDSDVISVPFDVWQHTIDVTLTGYMYGIRTPCRS
jgi:NAD(P)-dependent dehydrogenase (short-subunit alcohol dehydrogenase family)